MKKVFIYHNNSTKSIEIASEVKKKFAVADFEISENIDDVDLIVNVGGDGTLLSLMHEFDFPTKAIAGINTGHLGFFQEVSPENLDIFMEKYIRGEYIVQPYNIAKAEIYFSNKKIELRALNEFVIRGKGTRPIHLDIGINESFIEKFSGDGIIVSTPAGSTAYNYALGGALVDPRLNLLQVAPMAPMNNTAYRSLTSSILLPHKDKLIILPSDTNKEELSIIFDGTAREFKDIEKISLTLSRRKINLIRFNDTTFWDKVKEKFL